MNVDGRWLGCVVFERASDGTVTVGCVLNAAWTAIVLSPYSFLAANVLH